MDNYRMSSPDYVDQGMDACFWFFLKLNLFKRNVLDIFTFKIFRSPELPEWILAQVKKSWFSTSCSTRHTRKVTNKLFKQGLNLSKRDRSLFGSSSFKPVFKCSVESKPENQQNRSGFNSHQG